MSEKTTPPIGVRSLNMSLYTRIMSGTPLLPSDRPRLPSIREIDAPFPGQRRYRLSGGDLRSDWVESGKTATPWCEISVWGRGRQRHLGAYSGSVWPCAWPTLFLVQGEATRLAHHIITEMGHALLDIASKDETRMLVFDALGAVNHVIVEEARRE